MKNLPDKSHDTNASPVEHAGESFASTFSGAQPTCAPDALILPTRAELQTHWLNNIPSFAAVQEWHAFIKFLAASPVRPELN